MRNKQFQGTRVLGVPLGTLGGIAVIYWSAALIWTLHRFQIEGAVSLLMSGAIVILGAGLLTIVLAAIGAVTTRMEPPCSFYSHRPRSFGLDLGSS